MRFSAFVLALVAAVPSAASAQRTSPAISVADLRTRLFRLAHDSMAGRATGSEGGWKATEWIAAEFKRFGLEPAGENGSWFQTVPFFRYRPDQRGALDAGGTRLSVGRDVVPLLVPYHGRAIANAEVVVGGSAGDSTTWIDAAAARGRVVLLTPPATVPVGRQLNQLLVAPLQNRRFADAVLIVIPVLDRLGGDRRATMIGGRVQSDTTRRGEGALVTVATAAAAQALMGKPLAGLAPGARGVTVSGSVGLEYAPLDRPARNVVAILRGSDPTRNRSYAALTAHSDHVGFDRAPVDHDSLRAFNRVIRPMGADSPQREPTPAEWIRIKAILDSLRAIRPPRPDSIRNGADDDGSGTVALLEVAEALAAGPKPRRSVLFVAHAAEEEGLLGSAWFTDHPTVPIDSIVSELDMDMVGRGSTSDLPDGGPGYLEMIGITRLSKEYGEIFDRVNARQPKPFQFNLTFDQPGHPLQYYCRADHYSYARYGIPAVAMSRGEHLDYHQVSDEPEYIDYDALFRVASFAADVIREVAGLDHRPRLDRPRGDPRAACVQ